MHTQATISRGATGADALNAGMTTSFRAVASTVRPEAVSRAEQPQHGVVRRCVGWHRVFPLGFILALLTLLALASASPPDLWISGIDDEEGFDDVVVGTGAAATEAGRLALRPLARVGAEDAWIVVDATVPSYSVRAPPV